MLIDLNYECRRGRGALFFPFKSLIPIISLFSSNDLASNFTEKDRTDHKRIFHKLLPPGCLNLSPFTLPSLLLLHAFSKG